MNLWPENINFVNPEALLLLLLIPVAAVWYFYKRKKYYPKMKMPSLEAFKGISSIRGRMRALLPLLRAACFSLLVIALARPQETLKEENIIAEGIDIALVIDLSSSMLARDFKPDRLEASKRVASEFIANRPYDRIGLTVFAGESFTQCPLTTDHRVVQEFLGKIECGLLEDGTAIGMGLATAVNRLKDSDAKSKVVILLTDGVNNAGYVKPVTAAEIAREFEVKTYTIGVGSSGDAYAPVSRRRDGSYIFGLTRVVIDEDLLTQIAEMTGGKYYRATSVKSLERIYADIDKLEKVKIETTTIKRYSEMFYHFAMWGMILLILELILRYTVLRIIP